MPSGKGAGRRQDPRPCYSWERLPGMRLGRIFGASLLVVSTSLPALADARKDAKKHVEFGIEVAQKGLWREAIYRWEQAAKIDPNYSAAYNDLAVAYEHEGQFEK